METFTVTDRDGDVYTYPNLKQGDKVWVVNQNTDEYNRIQNTQVSKWLPYHIYEGTFIDWHIRFHGFCDRVYDGEDESSGYECPGCSECEVARRSVQITVGKWIKHIYPMANVYLNLDAAKDRCAMENKIMVDNLKSKVNFYTGLIKTLEEGTVIYGD